MGFNDSDPLIAGARRRNADLNGDHAERAGSTPRRVGMLGAAQTSPPSTTSKSLIVGERSVRPHGAIRLLPCDRRQRSAFRRSAVSRRL